MVTWKMGPMVNEFGLSSGAVIINTSVNGSMARMGIGSPSSPRSHTTLTRPRGSSPHRQTSEGQLNASPTPLDDVGTSLESLKRNKLTAIIRVNGRRRKPPAAAISCKPEM